MDVAGDGLPPPPSHSHAVAATLPLAGRRRRHQSLLGSQGSALGSGGSVGVDHIDARQNLTWEHPVDFIYPDQIQQWDYGSVTSETWNRLARFARQLLNLILHRQFCRVQLESTSKVSSIFMLTEWIGFLACAAGQVQYRRTAY
jgi:hypothetical protein